MKCICLALSLIILVLGFMPCKDSSAAPKLNTTVVQKDHSGTNPIQDHCSPFCQCSCCNTPSITIVAAQLFSIPVEVINSYPELAPSQIKNRNLIIWQPPKLIS
jgi:hypothetical protein